MHASISCLCSVWLGNACCACSRCIRLLHAYANRMHNANANARSCRPPAGLLPGSRQNQQNDLRLLFSSPTETWHTLSPLLSSSLIGQKPAVCCCLALPWPARAPHNSCSAMPRQVPVRIPSLRPAVVRCLQSCRHLALCQELLWTRAAFRARCSGLRPCDPALACLGNLLGSPLPAGGHGRVHLVLAALAHELGDPGRLEQGAHALHLQVHPAWAPLPGPEGHAGAAGSCSRQPRAGMLSQSQSI